MAKTGAHVELGRHGEDYACEWLETHGLVVVQRNYRCDAGEIDVLAIDGHTAVAVEVKTRRSLRFGHPREAVDQRKMRRLTRSLAVWLSQQENYYPRSRVDVVSLLWPEGEQPTVRHDRGVA